MLTATQPAAASAATKPATAEPAAQPAAAAAEPAAAAAAQPAAATTAQPAATAAAQPAATAAAIASTVAARVRLAERGRYDDASGHERVPDAIEDHWDVGGASGPGPMAARSMCEHVREALTRNSNRLTVRRGVGDVRATGLEDTSKNVCFLLAHIP